MQLVSWSMWKKVSMPGPSRLRLLLELPYNYMQFSSVCIAQRNPQIGSTLGA